MRVASWNRRRLALTLDAGSLDGGLQCVAVTGSIGSATRNVVPAMDDVTSIAMRAKTLTERIRPAAIPPSRTFGGRQAAEPTNDRLHEAVDEHLESKRVLAELPDVSGYDIAEAMRIIHGRRPVLVATSTWHDHERVQLQAAGFDDFVFKPVDAVHF